MLLLRQVDPSSFDPNAAAAPQYFYNFTSWRNAARGANCRNVGAAIHVGYNLIENGDHEFAWRLLDVAGMWDAQVRVAGRSMVPSMERHGGGESRALPVPSCRE